MTMTAPLELNSPSVRLNSSQHAHVSSQATSVPQGEAETGPTSINLILAALLGVAIVAAFVGFGGDAAANGPLQPASAQSSVVDTIEIYVVQPGDTLWSIATEVSVDGEDIRPLVDHLKAVAGGSSLDVGQRIVIDHATIRS